VTTQQKDIIFWIWLFSYFFSYYYEIDKKCRRLNLF